MSGDSADAVQKKVARGLWVDGLHIKTGPDGARWVNTEAVDQWVESGLTDAQATPTAPAASPLTGLGRGRGSARRNSI